MYIALLKTSAPFSTTSKCQAKRREQWWKFGRPPEMLCSGNVTCSVFLGEVVRNTGSSLSVICPWGHKHTVRSSLPESTKAAPKHELGRTQDISSYRYQRDRNSNPLNLPGQLTEAQPQIRALQAHVHTWGPDAGPLGARGTQRARRVQALVCLPSDHASRQDSLQFLQRSKSSMSFMEGLDLPQKSTPKIDEHTAQWWLFSALHFVICFLVLNIGEKH